jgi:hypothetical protein
MKRLILLIIILALFSPAKGFGFDKQKIEDVYVIIFIMDGLNYDAFVKGVQTGQTPTINKYFIKNGASFANAITVFPSVSSSAYLSSISGLFPGHSGVTYLGRFDRVLRKPINYFSISGHKYLDIDFLNLKALLDPNETALYPPSTIFDHLRGHNTAAIYSSFNAGAKTRKPLIPIPAFWSTFASKREEMLNKYAINEVFKLYNRPLQEIPRFTLVGLYGFDAHGHHYGAKSPILTYTLEQFDGFLSQFFDALKKKGIQDKTYVIIASDHGMHDTPKKKFDLKSFVGNTGLIKFAGQSKGNFDVYVASRGIASANLYIKGVRGWKERPTLERMKNYPLQNGKTIDIPRMVADAPELQFAVVRDGHYKTHIFSGNGHSIISTLPNGKGERLSYKIVDGKDPLELGKSRAAKLVGGKFYSAATWGKKMYDHIYSDAIVQFSQVFADGRAGDIYIVAAPDWVFFRNKSATHGAIYKDDMHVPLLIHGPNVPKGEHSFARLSDIYPTMLDWFGIPDDGRHDGKHLFKSSKHRLKNKRNTKSRINKTRKKLEHVGDYLRLQKEHPKQYDFTSKLVLDSNLWLVDEQLERLSSDAKTTLQ